jgi:predicted SAM-dependent methyltransferase
MKFSSKRSVWDYHKVQLARSALTRDRPQFMNLKKPVLILDVGCGANMRPENINLDYDWQPGVDVCCDITNGLPFPDNYVAGIFTEHCLEHIPFRSTMFVLEEFRRILQPGGYIRVVVPDLEIYIDSYKSGAPMPYASGDPVDGIYSSAMTINRIMRNHGHQFIYDFATMEKLLARSCFCEITKTRCGVGKLGHLDTPERAVESLYITASQSPN